MNSSEAHETVHLQANQLIIKPIKVEVLKC
jgi:hypothetical protein